MRVFIAVCSLSVKRRVSRYLRVRNNLLRVRRPAVCIRHGMLPARATSGGVKAAIVGGDDVDAAARWTLDGEVTSLTHVHCCRQICMVGLIRGH